MDGRNEIRAQYGGFFLAVAVVSALAATRTASRKAGLVVNAAVFGGLLGGRLASLAIDGGMSGYGGEIQALFLVDTIGFALSIAALGVDLSLARSRQHKSVLSTLPHAAMTGDLE